MATTNVADSSFWDDISQLLGKSAQGAGSGRAAEGAYRNQRDALAARLYDIMQTSRTQAAGQNLSTDKYRNALPGQGASEAVRGALIENAQPASLDLGSAAGRIPKMSFSGGTTPASYTPETRAAGAALAKHGTGLINDPGSAITRTPGSGVGGTDFLTPPALSPEPTAGFWENAAGATSIGTGLLGALSKALSSGGKGSSGGNLADLINLFKRHGPGGIDNSGNTEDTRTEDMRSTSSGVAYGPNGELLPGQGGGTDDAGGYYDENTGQYVPASYDGGGGGGGYDDAGGYYDESGEYVGGY